MANQKDTCLNRTVSHEMVVGTFVLTIFAALILFTIVLSGTKIFGDGGSKLDVKFDRVGGLRKHDSVLVRGVPVGQVESLRLGDDFVYVRLDIKQKVSIREGYTVRAESSSLLGGMQLVLEEGSGAPVKDGTILVGLSPDNVMDNINEAVTELRTAFIDGGILSNLEFTVANIAEVTQRLKNGEGTIGGLLSTNNTVFADLEKSIANIRKISDRLEQGEGTLGKLLSADSTVYDDFQSTIADIKVIADRVESGEGTLGKLMSSDNTLYNELSSAVANLNKISTRLEHGEGTLGKLLSSDDSIYTDLSATVSNLKLITGRIEKGDGLIGQLVNKDGEIGLQLNGLIKDGRDMLDDMRETSPISTFSSIFFGAF